MARPDPPRLAGFTLVEILAAVAISGILLSGLGGVISGALAARQDAGERNALARDARFAMERAVRAVSRTPRLLLPLADNPATNWREHVREQSIPPAPPEGDSTFATAVLAVTQAWAVDLDSDGFPDVDNDEDGLIDEDMRLDNHFDFAPGISGIDDDGDGQVDEGLDDDDDEDGVTNEDPLNGVDDDGDGSVDEDTDTDANGDLCPGYCGVDDDGDGQVDEGSAADDDEAGGNFEDWYDVVAFYLVGDTLVERTPVPWNEDGLSAPTGEDVDGRDFIVSDVADNVSFFRVERVPETGQRAQLVDLTLTLRTEKASVTVRSQVRVGGGL